MGYDTLILECELPEKANKFSKDWQTDDLDEEYKHYTVTKEGRLIKHETRSEEVPENERPYFGKPEWKKHAFYRLSGSIREVYVGDIDMDYHGIS